jgi:hypothetical protein
VGPGLPAKGGSTGAKTWNERGISHERRDSHRAVWHLISGSFRAGRWDESPNGETRPLPACEMVADETHRFLAAAGLERSAYELKVRAAPGGHPRDEECVVHVKLNTWGANTAASVMRLERWLRGQMRMSGVGVHGVYWRVDPHADLAPSNSRAGKHP